MARNGNRNASRKRIAGFQCVYCGESANSDEHFPPASASDFGLILPACRECNGMAGTEWAFDFELRAACVKAKIRKKYRAVLETPDWSNEEIRELGPGMRPSVKAWRARKSIVRDRLAWDSLAYIAAIDHNGDVERIAAGLDLDMEAESPTAA